VTSPFDVVQLDGSTMPLLCGGLHQHGAALAPALRNGVQNARIELELPVT